MGNSLVFLGIKDAAFHSRVHIGPGQHWIEGPFWVSGTWLDILRINCASLISWVLELFIPILKAALP